MLPVRLIAVAALLAGSPALDRSAPQSDAATALFLKDGRFILGRPLKIEPNGIRVSFPSATILVPRRLVSDCFSLADDFQYEPKNDVERKRLAKGLVPFRGNWIKKSAAVKRIAKLRKHLAEDIKAQAERKLWRNRRIAETKHFRFEHNLPDKLIDELKVLLDVFWGVYEGYWKRRLSTATKPTVNFFASRDDYQQISGARGGVVGWYSPVTKDLNFFWDRNDPRSTVDTLIHETTHCLSDIMNGRFRYPPWLEESLAEFFGSAKRMPTARLKSKLMTLGHLQPGRLMTVKEDIRRDKWLKLRDMIGMERFGADHYAWGWTFVHFLLSTKKYASRFRKYYLDLAHKRGIKRIDGPFGDTRTVTPQVAEELLLKYLKVKKLETLQQEWYDYIRSLEVESVAALEDAGRYVAMLGNRKVAKKLLQKAIDKGAKLPATYAVYASILNDPKERNKAITMIDRAIELDPLEAQYYYLKGQILLGSNRKRLKEELKRCALLAAEIEPDSWTYQAFAASIEDED